MNFKIPDEVKQAHLLFTNPPRNIECITNEYFYNDGIDPKVLEGHLLKFTNRFDKSKVFNTEYKLRITEYDGQYVDVVMLDCNKIDNKIAVALQLAKIKVLS